MPEKLSPSHVMQSEAKHLPAVARFICVGLYDYPCRHLKTKTKPRHAERSEASPGCGTIHLHGIITIRLIQYQKGTDKFLCATTLTLQSCCIKGDIGSSIV